ncbi:MAG: hypothetical protein H7Y42_12005 [Chitinophagaceae bacterium]|nr:hypothetical protein [Chitinophagaceae bacterium]
MKTMQLLMVGVVAGSLFTTSCQRDSIDDLSVQNQKSTIVTYDQTAVFGQTPSGPCNPGAFTITLESRTQVNGNWEWIWSAYNPNPGNGSNGTAQNLSHWGMQMTSCVDAASLVSAAYSGDGINWTSFTPSLQQDPSQGCLTVPVLKFDFGTTGSAKSYYRLVVNQAFEPGDALAYYKSGSRTGCCTFNFTGIGDCSGPVEIVERPVE